MNRKLPRLILGSSRLGPTGSDMCLLPVTRVVAVGSFRGIPLSQVFAHLVVNQLHPCFHRVLFCFDCEAMPLEELPRCNADVG